MEPCLLRRLGQIIENKLHSCHALYESFKQVILRFNGGINSFNCHIPAVVEAPSFTGRVVVIPHVVLLSTVAEGISIIGDVTD